MDIFSINERIVYMEKAILAKGYADAEVTVRMEDPANRSWNRRFKVDVAQNLKADSYTTREDKTFSLVFGQALGDAVGLMDEALAYVTDLPSKDDAEGAANVRSIETLVQEFRTLQLEAPTEELRTKYGSLADDLEAEIKEVNDLRYQAGYQITDQS